MIARTFAARARGRTRSSRGFTLIEILVVVAIIALLISILLPSLAAAKRQARIVVCASGLRTIMQSVTLYTNDYKDTMPTGPLFQNGKLVANAVNANMWEFLYPYVQKKSIRKIGPTVNDYEIRLELFTCPDDLKQHTSNQRQITLPDGTKIDPTIYLSYFANGRVIIKDYANTPAKIPQKLSTMKNQSRMVAMNDGGDDVGDGGGSWVLEDCMAAANQNQCPLELRHKTGNNFAFLDGHVEFYKFSYKGPQYGLPVYPFMWDPEYKSPGSKDNYVRPAPLQKAPKG